MLKIIRMSLTNKIHYSGGRHGIPNHRQLDCVFIHADDKENVTTPHHLSFVRGIQWPLVSPHNGSVMQKAFLSHYVFILPPWWRHQMETFSALLAICAGNSSVPGEFLAQRPVTRSFDVFFDLRLNKRLSKQSWGWWFETLPRPLWRHSNAMVWLYITLAMW